VVYINGGDGGSVRLSGRFVSNITGSSLFVGGGGNGATSSSTALIKLNYSDGGDGNGGLGFQGIVIFRFSATFITKFLEYTDWTKLFNVNLGDGLKLETNNLLSTYWKKRVSAYPALTNDIYNTNSRFVGIGTEEPGTKLHVLGSLTVENGNIAVYHDQNEITHLGLYNYDAGEFASIGLILSNDTGSSTITLFSSGSSLETPSLLKISNMALGDLLIQAGAYNGYIYIKQDVGKIGIGTREPAYKLDVVGDVKATSFIGSMNLNSGDITNGNEITANYFNGYLRGGISGSCGGNCGGNASSATYTNTWYPTTDIWFNSTDDRNRFHFVNDGSTYYKSHEHHVFRNYEDTDVCQIDTWGIIASFEEVTTARDY